MRIKATLFAIGLMAGCNAALAVETIEAVGEDTVNPFSGPLNIGAAGPRITVSGEDVSNPFSDAHPMEQGLYESLYYNHYHGLFYNVNESEGFSMYTRLYWAINQREDLEFNLFQDSLASWADMKRGFEDIISNYPHSALDINTFAAVACIAGDKETFQSLRFRIGKTITPQAWPSNYSVDVCEHKFGAQPL